ncbi:MAG TPA: tetraacyldisaccharide 4'-kinase [Thermosynergistes sp.]|nr:tetraacyldisaccharide 4'-kinase [Thermosynergistes sp.]
MKGSTASSSVIDVQCIVDSYLSFAREKRALSPWQVLSPLGYIAQIGVGLRNWAYDHGIASVWDPPLPVISVGNVTMGGTNKTPFVEMLTSAFGAMGLSVGIVTRGYGGRNADDLAFPHLGKRDAVGDEPLLLSSRLPGVPIAVCKRRQRGVETLKRAGVEIVVADDAFQHRRLGRDVNIVLIDATCPFGNGKLFPAGLLREPSGSLSRAHIAVITKADRAPRETVEALVETISRYVPEEAIFLSTLIVERWSSWRGSFTDLPFEEVEGMSVMAFSAIGDPESFRGSLEKGGVRVVGEARFRDHHRYTPRDMERICRAADEAGAEMLSCTEKDIYNLPEGWRARSLLIPRVAVKIDDEGRFWRALLSNLLPKVVVASNGHGEDSIGALLAQRLQEAAPGVAVEAFPLVGKGESYRDCGVKVVSFPVETPSGGIIKYNLRDFLADLRAGLLRQIIKQLGAWKDLRGKCRTPICVGDVYLLLHALFGQGLPPLLLATAKSERIRGHWHVEHYILRKRAPVVWTRDPETALELKKAGVNAIYAGNPIVDLLCDNEDGGRHWPADVSAKVLLLPGSRKRAYRDVALLLEASLLLSRRMDCAFLMVLAPTLDLEKLVAASSGFSWDPPFLEGEGLRVAVTDMPVGAAARGADIVIGLGGTANQLCAALGVPVLSVIEKGKLVQKKLLGDAELLVAPDAGSLAEAAYGILTDRDLKARMSEAGRRNMGGGGAVDDVVRYVVNEMGLALRCAVWRKIAESLEGDVGHEEHSDHPGALRQHAPAG